MDLTANDLAQCFGTTEEDIQIKCGELIAQYDLSYHVVLGLRCDALIVDILERIDADTQRIAAPERTEVWNNGWDENLQAFIDSGFDLGALTPKFIRPGQIVRLNGMYVQPIDPNFELHFFEIYRQWLFKTYANDATCVYEFGSGTGFNLVALAKLYPHLKLYGSDFVQSSCDLINKIAEAYKLNLTGYRFDMITPDYTRQFEESAVVFTIGAIEQLGGKFQSFIDYLLANNNLKRVVHVEPMIEVYETNRLFDYLAYKFHKKRGYTIGLLPYLQQLEQLDLIKIDKLKRINCGSLYMEGYNLLVWRPTQWI